MTSDSQPSEHDAKQLVETIQQLSDLFTTLCQERHLAGAKEYGDFTFLENDVTRMLAEELADTANYCRMQFIKIMMLQRALVEELPQGKQELADDMGMDSFRGAGEVGWTSSSSS